MGLMHPEGTAWKGFCAVLSFSQKKGAVMRFSVYEVDTSTGEREHKGDFDGLNPAVRCAYRVAQGENNEASVHRYRMGPDTLFLREGSYQGAILVVR
jgi:hypothetical protein